MPESASKIDFFNSYFELLERNEIDYVILHTYAEFPETIHSDVDYCVSNENLEKIISLVFEHCQASGWRLVQIMQHEVKAFFCVCVSIDDPTQYIELDVCSDYMREGKILIEADKILNNRRSIENKSFYVPAPGMEFCYALWKSIAKKKSKEVMLPKLQALYVIDSKDCERCLKEVGVELTWKEETEQIYVKLRRDYQKKRLVSVKNRLARLTRRVTQPSGLLVLFKDKDTAEDIIGSDYFTQSMQHCFRGMEEQLSDIKLLASAKKILKSTLVLSHLSLWKSKLLRFKLSLVAGSLELDKVSKNEAVSTIHRYLEQRLVSRWKIVSLQK